MTTLFLGYFILSSDSFHCHMIILQFKTDFSRVTHEQAPYQSGNDEVQACHVEHQVLPVVILVIEEVARRL